jgi:hypothetical protein
MVEKTQLIVVNILKFENKMPPVVIKGASYRTYCTVLFIPTGNVRRSGNKFQVERKIGTQI